MEPEFQNAHQRTREEEEELDRSVKKFKDSSGDRPLVQPRSQVSYKDSLIGDIPGAYAQAFRFDKEEIDDVESDSELEEISEGLAEVKLSKETKARIRAPWTKALIVKVFGRTVGYNYLTFKINALWKPAARMNCVELSKDFFLIKFSDDADCDKVLRGGPWFIGEHFLAIKPWEPCFKASEASFSSVAVWVRFPELPIEFYDRSVLLEIGKAIGPVMRIDSYTASDSRGSYARLCIQIDLMKRLINTIKVGRLYQKVLYEGLSSLCFGCGRVGHKQEACSYREQPKDDHVEPEPTPTHPGKKADQQPNPSFGAWMLVTRKKRSVRNKRVVTPKCTSQQIEPGTKGSTEGPSTSLTRAITEMTFLFMSGSSQKADLAAGKMNEAREGNVQNTHKDLMEICKYKFEKLKTPFSSEPPIQRENVF
nr:uncharacterized protein CFP56_64448 [Quercus suber]